MSKSQRDKGNRGERYIVKKFLAAGFNDAKRNYADKAIPEGIDVFAGPWLVQVKYWGRPVPMSCYREIKRTDGFRLLVSKDTSKPREPWMATLALSDFLLILQDVSLAWDKGLVPPF